MCAELPVMVLMEVVLVGKDSLTVLSSMWFHLKKHNKDQKEFYIQISWKMLIKYYLAKQGQLIIKLRRSKEFAFMYFTCSELTHAHTCAQSHRHTVSKNAHCIPPMVYITEMMCFSSSLLITVSHTLLPGPPQRKLNAASSV